MSSARLGTITEKFNLDRARHSAEKRAGVLAVVKLTKNTKPKTMMQEHHVQLTLKRGALFGPIVVAQTLTYLAIVAVVAAVTGCRVFAKKTSSNHYSTKYGGIVLSNPAIQKLHPAGS